MFSAQLRDTPATTRESSHDIEIAEEHGETLCQCCAVEEGPLDGVEDDLDTGTASGIRVKVLFKVFEYPPRPLGEGGAWPPAKAANELPGAPVSPPGGHLG